MLTVLLYVYKWFCYITQPTFVDKQTSLTFDMFWWAQTHLIFIILSSLLDLPAIIRITFKFYEYELKHLFFLCFHLLTKCLANTKIKRTLYIHVLVYLEIILPHCRKRLMSHDFSSAIQLLYWKVIKSRIRILYAHDYRERKGRMSMPFYYDVMTCKKRKIINNHQ